MNNKWECYICGKEKSFERLPHGYLANYQPLCNTCADDVLEDSENKHRFRLTYHRKLGDITMVLNVPIQTGYYGKN